MRFKVDKKYIAWGLTAFFAIAAAICFYYLVYNGDRFAKGVNTIMVITSPILYGLIFAYLLSPLVNFLEREFIFRMADHFKWKRCIKANKRIRMGVIALTYILVLFLLYGFFALVIPQIFTSIRNISIQFPYYVKNITNWSNKFLADNPTIEDFVVQIVDTYSVELNNYLNNSIIPQMEIIVRNVSLSLLSAAKVMWNLIIGMIISVYVLGSKELFAGQSKKIIYALFESKTANRIIKDLRFTSSTFIGFLGGKVIDSAIIGVLCFIGTSFMKTPYALLISVIVGITNIIPFFGPYFGAIPSALLILMVNPMKCLYFIIFILILQQLDGNLIGPKILGQSTGLSGFWVIFSITFFGGLWGVFGMIIGVPLFAVFYALIKRITSRLLKNRRLPTNTANYLNVGSIQNHVFIDYEPVSKKKKGEFAKSEDNDIFEEKEESKDKGEQ